MNVGSARYLICLVALCLVDAGDATAQNGPPALSLTGYGRSLIGFQELGYDVPFGERRSAFNSQVLRLKWQLSPSPTFRITAHNRLQLRLTSAAGASNVIGFGVSTAPTRSIDLEQVLVETDRVRLWHDLDRLSVTAYLDVADITMGRQAITWGISTLFPVADLWAQFSPFELDTEEKRGLDAVRALMYPGSGLELDVVIADRGSRRDLSAGFRLTAELPSADVYWGVGKFWRELIGMAGASVVLDSWKIRAEISLPWSIDSSGVHGVRTTVGADWISASAQLTLEYHHNGYGATSPAEYTGLLSTAPYLRGETYHLGRDYFGGALGYRITDRLSFGFSTLLNARDPSGALTPSILYDAGQRLRIGAGGLVSLGDAPFFPSAGLPSLTSEYGTYGHFGYTQVSVYF